MVLKRIAALLALWVLVFTLSISAAGAHEKKHDQAATAATQQQPVAGASAASGAPVATHDMDRMMKEMEEDRSNMSTIERLINWLGRLHPIIVHFPLAFFPAAFFTAVVGRRRPAFAKPVQFLVVAGGIIAPLAMLLGWFDGGLTLTDTDPLLRVHRWLGTVIGFSGLALAVWAWKRPEEDRQPGMLVALGGITAAIIVQGWFGGALVHGVGHMNW